MEQSGPAGGNAAREHLTVLLADGDVVFRRGVREALEAGGLIVVGEVGDAAGAIGAASRLDPDICLIELELAGEGANAIGRIAKRSPQTLIVVLSSLGSSRRRGRRSYPGRLWLSPQGRAQRRAPRLHAPRGSPGRAGAVTVARPTPRRRNPSRARRDASHCLQGR